MADFTVTIIGSGSAVPMHGRHPSAQVVQYEDLHCLIDCGEGTQLRFREAGIKPFRIQVILISHLHGDHVYGLPGLLSSYSHLGRTEPLRIIGPRGLRPFLDAIMFYSELKIRYPIDIQEAEPTGLQRILSMKGMDIFTFPLKHRIPCNGYLFRETNETIHVNKEKIEQMNLNPGQIKQIIRGEPLHLEGLVIPADEFLLSPWPRMSYAYCSDTAYDEQLVSFIHGASVLYHETTFKADMSDLARETGHSTTADASNIARAAEVSCLLMGHYSSRYKDLDELKMEAQFMFRHAILSEEGKRYRIRDLASGNVQG
ncbi:MAG TPA: ribonuclease Z [Saprospiraceae bacterium]|nr:ribonuclease Z [Saprospiraceae bacterium]